MPLIIRLFMTSVVLWGVTACNPQQQDTQTKDETAAEKTRRMNHGVRNIPTERMLRSQTTAHYRVSYVPETDPIPLNAHFRLRVNIQDLSTSRAPEPPMTLTADADMPEHNHGMQTTPETDYFGQGQYEIKGLLFHMAGYWELKLDVLNAEGQKETVVFGVEVQDKPTQSVK